MTQGLPGAIVECGVFKGASFVRFAGFRDLLGHSSARSIIGFDVFGAFPGANRKDDKKRLRTYLTEVADDQSISREQLLRVLKHKSVNKNIELIKGNILKTVPQYVALNPQLKISLLNMDVDIYEPTAVILEHLWPKIVKGGILLLDDYGNFPGETKAVDEYFAEEKIKIRKLSFASSPAYIIKE